MDESEYVRERYMDVLKVSGTVAIVALHTLSRTGNAIGWMPDGQRLTIHILHQFFYTAVPLFVMGTGAGFLTHKRDNSYRGMRKHIVKLLSCIILFGILFGCVNQLAAGGSIQLRSLIQGILGGGSWSHMWYLYRLLGVYLCMPLVSAFTVHASRRDQVIFAGILFFFFCLCPLVAGLLGYYVTDVMPVEGIWLFYVLVGVFLDAIDLKMLKRYKWIALAGIFAGAAGILIVGIWQGTNYIFNEAHPLTLLLAVSLFATVRILWGGKQSRPFLERLAANSLGVYVIHPIFIHACVLLLGLNPLVWMPVFMAPLTVFIIFAASEATVYLLKRIPLITKYLF